DENILLPPLFPARAREQREHEPDPAAVVPKGDQLRPGDGGGGGPGGGVDEQLSAPDPGVEIRRGRVRGVRGRLKISTAGAGRPGPGFGLRWFFTPWRR